MRENTPSFFVIADQRRARLFESGSTRQGRATLLERERIEHEWTEHERGRPCSRSGKDGHSYAAPSREDEEERQRFARRVSTWLLTILRSTTGTLFLVVPARFLGALRSLLPRQYETRLRLVEAELTNLSTAELVRHPVVSRALAS